MGFTSLLPPNPAGSPAGAQHGLSRAQELSYSPPVRGLPACTSAGPQVPTAVTVISCLISFLEDCGIWALSGKRPQDHVIHSPLLTNGETKPRGQGLPQIRDKVSGRVGWKLRLRTAPAALPDLWGGVGLLFPRLGCCKGPPRTLHWEGRWQIS